MDIILLERIEKLGTIGDVVTVKDGYARNFLLPQNKALRANEANKKVFEANRERLEKENAEKRGEAEKLGEKVAGAEVVLLRASSNAGQLYGSVNVRDMVAGLTAQDDRYARCNRCPAPRGSRHCESQCGAQ
jgi:large subunit ribosomal protein L9